MHYMKSLLYGFFILFFLLQKITITCDATPNPNRAMLIFLDDTEFMNPNILQAIFIDLASALSQKAGPILVSRNLLAIIASRYLANHTNSKKIDWQAKHTRATIYRRPESYDMHDILLEASRFNPSDWIFKKINDCLYMLLPTTYIQENSININDLNQFVQTNEPTALELTLGLKINHMQTVELNSISHSGCYNDYFLEALYSEKKNNSSIFCLNSDYISQRSITKPIWSLYIVGHGNINSLITNLSLASFKIFLNFLATKITTSLLVYVSCYAAGSNAEKIYSDSESAIQKTYPYAIITKALTDAPTNMSVSAHKRILTTDFIDGKIIFRHPYTNYLDFLSLIKHGVTNYKKIASSLFQDLSPSGRLSNTAQIKLPGIEWFSVLADNKNIFSIGSNLAKTRTKPMNITTFSKGDPKAILLYTPYIPFEIKLDSNSLEAIISMIPGSATHYIEKISSSQKNLMEILNTFASITMLGVTKKFIIHEIEIANTMNGIPQITKNIVIYNDPSIKDSSTWKTFLFLGSTIYSYQNNRIPQYQETNAQEKVIYGKMLREAQLPKQQFSPSEMQLFDIAEAYQKKQSIINKLLKNLFALENNLQTLATLQ